MTSLDDFFKKRDKKKKTTKSKLDIDEFAKKLEATTITSGDADDGGDAQDLGGSGENAAVANSSAGFASASVVAGSVGIVNSGVVANGGGGGGGGEQVDEEWKPFDSDENKDYTGLRININNWKVEDEYGENDGGYNDNEKKPSFKWGEKAAATKNKKDDMDEEEEEVEEKVPPPKPSNIVETKTETTNAPGGSYVPPALRRQLAESSSDKPSSTPSSAATTSDTGPSKYVPPSMRNKTTTESAIPSTSVNYRRPNKAQPNIMDTMEFPTLDSADSNGINEKVSSDNSNERFELPKKSGKVDPKTSKNMINLGNAFSALSS